MKKLVDKCVLWSAIAFNTVASAQIDRAGNVISEGSPGGAGIGGVITGIAIGALIGAACGWVINSQNEKKIAIDGCAVVGGLIGMLASPLLAMFL